MDDGILTAEDIAAMRLADDCVCLDHTGPGVGKIRCYAQPAKGDPYQTRRERIIVLPSRIDHYGNGGSYRATDGLTAYAYLPQYSFDSLSTMQTVAALCKPGDKLRLRWTRNNGNGCTRAHGLVEDTVHIERLPASVVKSGKSARWQSFLIYVSIGEANSARLVRTPEEARGFPTVQPDRTCSGATYD